MSQLGTFGMFTTVRLGVYTSQQGLSLTGNNIANLNTEGYTRQTLDIKSMTSGATDRYTSSTVRTGSGAYAYGVSQMRDPYLDIRYRTECANVGYTDTKMDLLNELESILDEVGDGDDENGVISAQLSALLSAFQNLTEYTGQGEFDTQVRASADALVKLFKSYADRLDTVEQNAQNKLDDRLSTINNTLSSIQKFTTNIRKGDINGNPSLEMRDERNRLIDELSEYLNIDVRYETENIAPGVDIEKLTIRLDNGDNPPTYLVDGVYAAQLELTDSPAINPEYDGTNATKKYLDTNGQPTDDIKQAKLLKAGDEGYNYDIKLTELKDVKGNTKTYYTAYDAKEVSNDKVTINGTEIDVSDKIIALGTGTSYTWTGTDGNIYTLQATNINGQSGHTVSMVAATPSTEKTLDDTDLHGSLQAIREFLTETGEFATTGYVNSVDSTAATKRGIKYYQNALDLLAQKFADTMNAANNGYLYAYDTDGKYYYVDKDGKFITNDARAKIEKKASLDDLIKTDRDKVEANGVKANNSGNLFSTSGDNNEGKGITASNISISADWASGAVQVVSSYEVVPNSTSSTVASTNNSNILHFIYLMNADLDYAPNELITNSKKDTMFTGSFGEMLGNINAVLGRDQYSTQLELDNYYTTALELDTSRDSVSSVDLNDETVNMMQYQKSYSAACRLMTTMDEILDKLINSTGTAGR